MIIGSMPLACPPAGRGTRPGADPHSDTTTCAEGPPTAAPQRGEGGLSGGIKQQGGMQLQGPPMPPSSRLQRSAQPTLLVDPTSSLAWCCWCDLCLLGSPKGETNKHPSQPPSQHQGRLVHTPRPAAGLRVLKICSFKGHESCVPAGSSCWCLHTPSESGPSGAQLLSLPMSGTCQSSSAEVALGNSKLHSTGKTLWRLHLCRYSDFSTWS